MRDGEKKQILINSVIVPVTASGMVNFFSLTSFILKMDYLHFQAFYIIYTHGYYKMLRRNVESSPLNVPPNCSSQHWITLGKENLTPLMKDGRRCLKSLWETLAAPQHPEHKPLRSPELPQMQPETRSARGKGCCKFTSQNSLGNPPR